MRKQLKETTLYEGKIFTLTQDDIEIENGMTMKYDVIHHHGGAGILPIKDGHVLLVCQYRYPAQKKLWEVPAGKIEQDEDPYVCAIRELEEESGLASDHVEFLTSFYSTPGFCSEIISLYLAYDVYPLAHPKAMDEDECIETKWFSFDEIQAMLLQHEIEDAKTIIALQALLLQEH